MYNVQVPYSFIYCRLPQSRKTLAMHVVLHQLLCQYIYSTGVLILLAGQVLSLFDADLKVMHNVLCSHHKTKMCKVEYYVCPESHVKMLCIYFWL